MKKLLVGFITLIIFLGFNNTNALQVSIKGKYPTYFNVYKNQFLINLSTNNKSITYNNKLLNKDFVTLLKIKKHFGMANKLKINIQGGQYDSYIGEVYNLGTSLDGYNASGMANIEPNRFRIEKQKTNLNLLKFNNGINYIIICYSTNLNNSNYEHSNIPFKYAFCSIPVKVYSYNGKIFLNINKYLKYKNEINNKQVNKINSKLNFIKKQLNYYKLNGWFEKVEIYIKDYIDENYKSNLSNLGKQRILFNLTNILYKKFGFYNGKIIIPNLLSKKDIYFVTAYYYKQYANQINNQYQQKLNQKEQYKQEALSNYGTLQQSYNKLKQEYTQYKLKTIENRQKAIKLTIVLTKILSKYHNKETKLKLLDKIDQIIATKYGPDKFKNQDLIGYVKDYLIIIKLAIQLSE